MIERRNRKLVVALTPGEHAALAHMARGEGEAMAVVVRKLIRQAACGPQISDQTTPSAALGDRHGTEESTKGILTKERRIELRRILDELFNMGELRGLCFDMHIDFEELAGATKPEKVIALIEFCERRGRISELETKVYTLRPNASLEDMPE